MSADEGARSVAFMTEFLVETYVSPTDASSVQHLAKCARLAAEELSDQGIQVRYVRSIFVPEEETCFIFYDALCADTARRAASLDRRRPVCTRALNAGTLSLAAHSGPDRVFFEGRVARTRRLRPDVYTTALTATNAAGRRSESKSLTFTIRQMRR